MIKTKAKMMMYGCIIGMVILVFSVAWYTLNRRLPYYTGFKGVPGMSFVEVKSGRSFAATVESKKRGIWNPLVDSATHKTVPGAKPTEYVMVYLAINRWNKLCLNKENPTTNELAFFASLDEGETYRFPDVLIQWERKHGSLEKGESAPP